MKEIRIFKVVAYPVFAVVQLLVVPNKIFASVLALALVGVAYLNLRRLLVPDEKAEEIEKGS